MINKYRVRLLIRGTPIRPQYTGHTDVYASSVEGAKDKAKRLLRKTTFSDARWEDFKILSVEVH